jgi:hypothetical protein
MQQRRAAREAPLLQGLARRRRQRGPLQVSFGRSLIEHSESEVPPTLAEALMRPAARRLTTQTLRPRPIGRKQRGRDPAGPRPLCPLPRSLNLASIELRQKIGHPTRHMRVPIQKG